MTKLHNQPADVHNFTGPSGTWLTIQNPFTDTELQQLYQVWLQVERAGWLLPSGFPSTPLLLPSDHGGCPLLIPWCC